MPLDITINDRQYKLVTSSQLEALESLIKQNEEAIRVNKEAIEVNVGQIAESKEEILAALNLIGSEPTDPLPPDIPTPLEGITVGPDDDLQEAIFDANGQKIWLKDGIYEPVTVESNTSIAAINPHKAFIEGIVPWEDKWEKSGQVWSSPLFFPLHQHPANSVHTINGQPSARGLRHRQEMQPHLLLFNGQMMDPVYDSSSGLQPGQFFLEGTSAKPVRIWARFPGDADPSSYDSTVEYGFFEYLIKGLTGDVDQVSLDGIHMRFCSNTGTFGGLHMEAAMDGWTVNNCIISDTMSEGARIRGSEHTFTNTKFLRHGHVGAALQGTYKCNFISCEASYNVWRKGIDPLWHAGGLKGQYGVNECDFLYFKAISNNGAGYWLDIHNSKNNLVDFELVDNQAFGLHIGHNTKDGLVENGVIRGTRKFHAENFSIGSGLQIQRGVTGYTFRNIHLEANEDGAVYYKKREAHGEWSGGNTFDNITRENNGSNNRWAVQGDMNIDPDSYLNMATPNFSNWQ